LSVANVAFYLALNVFADVPVHRQAYLCDYIEGLYQFFTTYQFAYLEINPLVVTDNPGNVGGRLVTASRGEI
jgi:succinyl-CoA synthetase beta subunit